MITEREKHNGNNGAYNDGAYDLVCFSHLRWNFVFQRPQHLMTRFARRHRVLFIEEPEFGNEKPRIEVADQGNRLYVVTPQLPNGSDVDAVIPGLLNGLASEFGIADPVTWFYTPMMIGWKQGMRPRAVVYDCMDELSAFRFAPPELIERERQLLEEADLVFTGGRSLYERKRRLHPSVFAFPSSIDVAHFRGALSGLDEPEDQRSIPHPRIGFCGVIDERTDLELLAAIAEMRPDWHFVMLGPVVKISPAELPHRDNIHYLGARSYEQLPYYIGGWDVAMMPFALNESTRYISPTKTPEYLAAGRPVVSTPVNDVVRPYGEEGLVHIASGAREFVSAIEKAVAEDGSGRQARADEFLSTMSWDKTQTEMAELIDEVIAGAAARGTAAFI
jgi:UDP-galactopyranose mutase